MDPVACLRLALEHFEDECYDEAMYSLEDYFAWRLKGGFEPTGGDERALYLQAAIAHKIEIGVLHL